MVVDERSGWQEVEATGLRFRGGQRAVGRLVVAFLVAVSGTIFAQPTRAPRPSAATRVPRPPDVPSRAHPLDPLSSAEITAAVRIIRESDQFPKGALFPTVVLREPPKEEVLDWKEIGRASCRERV